MTIEVSAGIIVDAGRVLVCRRRSDQPHPSQWEFPGGKREPGESMPECLRRELREELGIEAEVGAEVWRTDYVYPGRALVRLVFFLVVAYRGTIENRVFAEARWAAVDALAQLDFLEADRELIERLAHGEISLP
jgi:8-oxo-dGTP diphosphatase